MTKKVNLDQRKQYWQEHPEIWNTPCPKCEGMFMSQHGLKIHNTKMHKLMKDDVNEKILRNFDDILKPLYLEVEASIAEDLHVRIAQRTAELLADQRTQLKEAVEGKKKYFAQLAMTEDVYAYNEGLDDALQLIEGKE